MIEYDIWTHVPDFSTPPREARVGKPDVVGFAAAPEFVSFPQSRVERILVFGFAWDVVRDWTLAKQFWSEKGGRAEVFLMPSWKRDLTLAAAPTTGTKTITVTAADYAASFLTTTRRDEVGRYIYIWDQVGGLFVAKVLSASVVSGGSQLTLEQALPFTPYHEAFVGFALLVRFDNDESEWISEDPTHVRTQLTFRTVRESIVTASEGALEGVEQYESLPFTAFEQTVENTPVRYDVAEVLGPLNYRIAQNATYAVNWAAWPSSSGIRLLKNATPGSITPPDESQGFLCPFVSGSISTDHVALAFDQNAFEVLAWHSATNQITLKSSTVTVVFTGFAPSLFYNGQVNIQARIDGTTDVVCYYLKKGSAGLFARFQRDNYATEYLLGGYPTRPFYLLQAHSVDGLVHSITAIDEGFRKMRLDATYPTQPAPLPDPYVILAFAEAAGVTAAISDILDEYAIVELAALTEEVGAVGTLPDLESEYTAPPPTNFTEAPGAAASIPDILYELVVIPAAPPQEAAGTSAALTDITHDLIITNPQLLQEAAGASASIPDIYFGP